MLRGLDARWIAAGKWLVAVLVLVGLGWLIARDWAVLRVAMAAPSAPDLALAMAVFVAAETAFCLGWSVLARRERIALGVLADSRAWAISLVGRYVPGKVWQAGARLAWYSARGRPVAPVVVAVIREQALAMAVAALVVLSLLETMRPLSRFTVAVLAAVAALGIAAQSTIAVGLVARMAPRRIGALLERTPRVTRAAHLGWVAAAAMVGGYAAFGVGAWLLAVATAPATAPTLANAAASLALAGLAGVLLPVAPAGLGVREAALAWSLAPALGAAPAALVALLIRITMTAADALLVLAALAAGRLPVLAPRRE